uniref:F-box domain-containing protein n=1 Tax=Ganoderma boninense TaxID=34458 RepID=A0A5K1JTM6_9APHY|nr:Uncharacterized protein [Ganoderma boninense]
MSTSFLALTGWHDVFHQILNHLDRPKDGYDDDDYNGNIYYTTLHTFQNTLLSLALSCHAFLDPSLDRLWHDLNNIHPLLKLLPNYQNHGSICVQRLRLGDHAILNEDVLRRLANLENLTELTVSILFRDSVALVSAQLNERVGFRNLTTLDLRGQPADVTRFILASPMARLNDVRIRLNDHSADEFLTYIPSICQHLGPHTLTTFQAELGDFVHPPRVLMDLIEPLFHFVNLKRLELFFEEHLPLRDADLERIARTWPQLQALILMQSENTVSDPDTDPGSVERPTLRGLVELARGCPELAQICIPDLDATAACIPDADSVPLLAHGARNLCIQNLIDAEGKEEQLGVAVVLDRVFPRLKLEHCGIEWIPGYGESANPHLEDSENVSLLLRAMQMARRHYPGGV